MVSALETEYLQTNLRPLSLLQLTPWREGGLQVSAVGSEGRLEETSELPFDFRGGYVGYLGYELQHDCMRMQRDPSSLRWKDADVQATTTGSGHSRDVPDAVMSFTDRFLAVDHETDEIYIMALTSSSSDASEALAWQSAVERHLRQLEPVPVPPQEWLGQPSSKSFIALTSEQSYKNKVGRCFEAMLSGDSYEICLTNPFLLSEAGVNPRQLYSRLRRQNPAPYSAFFLHDPRERLADSEAPISTEPAVGVCSSSPERFLKVSRDAAGDWVVESKPIKGTIRRGKNPKEDEDLANELSSCTKNRAENLMIVDLVRNDLARVCDPGSVVVPSLMHIESFATVHQLVSTIRGNLKAQYDVVDAIVASFPGGSMTGAPKVRTMAIINELEGRPRGVYSGTLGFLSVDGAADLNIVIRTAVVTPQNVTINAGGAVVFLSSAEEEYNEMMLKARAVSRVIASFEEAEQGESINSSPLSAASSEVSIEDVVALSQQGASSAPSRTAWQPQKASLQQQPVERLVDV